MSLFLSISDVGNNVFVVEAVCFFAYCGILTYEYANVVLTVLAYFIAAHSLMPVCDEPAWALETVERSTLAQRSIYTKSS